MKQYIRRPRLTPELLEARNLCFYDFWTKYKNRWTMADLAKALYIPLPTLFQIIRETAKKVGKK